MFKYLVIGLGGAIGSAARYYISGLDYKFSKGVFPVSTFLINASGSFLIGFLWGVFDRFAISPVIRLFIFIGILGGYTTFSTFSLENLNLMRDGEWKIALGNIVLSNAAALLSVFAGFVLARCFLNFAD